MIRPFPSNPVAATTQDVIPFAPTKIAFDKHRAFIIAIKPDDTREARVDVHALFVRSATVLPALGEMRPLIVERLPDVNLEVYDSIQDRFYAAHYCNTLWQAKVNTNKEDVTVLAETLEARYDDALAAYNILVKFRLVSDEPRSRLKPMNGYDALSFNAGLVLGVLRELAPDVLSQTPVKPRDVDQLEHDLLTFQTAWGRREYSVQSREDAAVLRAQAFTYLYEAYEVARRAAMYLYGLERANELVPSLFITNGERKAKRGDGESGAGDSNTAASNTGASNGQPPTTNAQAKPAARAAAVTPATFVMDNAANLPLTSPFDLSSDKE